jgi:nucleoside-diphosphate-sugar epimerase
MSLASKTPHVDAMPSRNWIVDTSARILVTGAAGFIGLRVVEHLLRLGFSNLRCFVRPTSDIEELEGLLSRYPGHQVEVVAGNLLSQQDCDRAAEEAAVCIHLVTGRGKSFPACFQNSVVTTRNLLDAIRRHACLRRFVNVSSFAVYSNLELRRGAAFDESCPVESRLDLRHDAYVYAKLKQDELVNEYANTFGVPVVTVRPSIVFGPGRQTIPGAVGLDTFGAFLHLGGGNRVPLTFVDNCAEAIVLAGLVEKLEGQVFNVVDDDLPTSRSFLKGYKKRVRPLRSWPVPYPVFLLFCSLWESYARRTGQLPPVFNRRFCSFHWKGHRYLNTKAKQALGWRPRVPMSAALEEYYAAHSSGGRQ